MPTEVRMQDSRNVHICAWVSISKYDSIQISMYIYIYVSLHPSQNNVCVAFSIESWCINDSATSSWTSCMIGNDIEHHEGNTKTRSRRRRRRTILLLNNPKSQEESYLCSCDRLVVDAISIWGWARKDTRDLGYCTRTCICTRTGELPITVRRAIS
jgi:hypothetical protein